MHRITFKGASTGVAVQAMDYNYRNGAAYAELAVFVGFPVLNLVELRL
jgi:hypothetical protein